MKKIIIIVFAVVLSLPAYSQLGVQRDRLIIDLNWNGWTNSPEDIDLRWYSRGANFYFMFDIPFGEGAPVSFAAGGGLGIDNYYHNGAFHLDTSDILHMRPIEQREFSNNKLNTVYFDIPLELRLRTQPAEGGRSIKASVGFKAGMLIDSKVKYVGQDLAGTVWGQPQSEVTVKQKGVPNTERFRYGVTARAGYANFQLAAFYGLSQIFEEGRGPEMQPITIGLTITLF